MSPSLTTATYFNGRTPVAHDVSLLLHGASLIVIDRRGITLDRQPLAQIRVQEALGSAPQRVELGNGASLVVHDKDRLAMLLAGAGIQPGLIERAQGSWTTVGCALVALFALMWALYLGVLPWAASMAARWLPSTIESRFASDVWPQMDRRLFTPSRLPEAQQIELRGQFARLVAKIPGAPDYQLEFRSWNGGANAYALPGALIVVTDDLVARSDRGPALMGTLAHELGHVAYRHTLRTMMQGAAVSAVFSLYLGDAAALAATIPISLVALSYSRDFERAADDYAIGALSAAAVSPAPLADLLESLQSAPAPATRPSASEPPFLSTHPITAERVARLRAAAATHDRRPATQRSSPTEP